jgi:transposase
MNRPRSRDLRERALGQLDAGRPVAEVATVFGVHRSTVFRWRRQRAAGVDGPRPRRPRPAKIGPTERPRLVAQVQATPDATLREHAVAWATTTGVAVSEATMCRALQKAGWPLKKRR